jgi:hypothetical protein
MQLTNRYAHWYQVEYMIRNLAGFAGAYRVDRLVRINREWIVQVTYG